MKALSVRKKSGKDINFVSLEIPVEQQKLVLRRMENAKTDPDGWLDWRVAKKMLQS